MRFAHLFSDEAKNREPDLQLAMDLGREAFERAHESMAIVASRAGTPIEAGLVIMVASAMMYDKANRDAALAGGPVAKMWATVKRHILGEG